MSHRCLFSPNSIHSSLFLTKLYHLTLCKRFILISLLQNEEEYMVEIILDDVVERLVANVISIATENINFEWGFKDKGGGLKDLVYTLCKIHIVLHDAQKRQVSDNSVRI